MLARLRPLAANRHPVALMRALAGSARRPGHRLGGGGPLEWHVEATYKWLCRAQDASPDGGVAGIFDLYRGRWTESYPETTGYIIPTLLTLAEVRGDDQAYERAIRMADWASAVQMEDGAVLSGLLGMRRGPAVFNTGQAVFGWLAAYQRSGDERYAASARQACEWLLAHQDLDGAWRSNLSEMTTASVHAYNGRCAWALMFAADELGDSRFADAAAAASDWVLRQQNDAGWFAHNAFAVDETPLLHTISYVIEGLLGVYAFGGERRYLDAARVAADAIVRCYESGGLAGRMDGRWRSTVSWRCPTGEAQIAVVLHRLATHFPQANYRETAGRLIADVGAMQLSLTAGAPLTPGSGPAVGGLSGSYPVWGQYVRFGLPNWAAKFFLDALLLETRDADEQGFPRLPEPQPDT